ncbi:MAG: hypothetical protein J2O49_02830 [Sciscionella sp.]|nr:hypothetical protein [Sciscionella sp.]
MTGELSRRRAFRLGGVVLGGGIAAGVAVGTSNASTETNAAATDPTAATDWIRLPVITANIGRKHLDQRDRAIHDVRYGDAGYLPLVGWQEIGEGDTGEPAMIAKHFGSRYQNEFLRSDKAPREPMSIPKVWKVISARSTFVHHGIAKVTPSRWINEVVVQHAQHTDLRFAMLNTHYIANAYNGDRRHDLQALWDKHKRIHKERVLAHHQQGRLVIWTADTNRRDYTTATGRAAERQVFHNGIDRINWLPGTDRVRLELHNTKTVDMHVDEHDAHVAIFQIRLA